MELRLERGADVNTQRGYNDNAFQTAQWREDENRKMVTRSLIVSMHLFFGMSY